MLGLAGEHMSISFVVDRMAVKKDSSITCKLMMASFVAYGHQLKALRAYLNTNRKGGLYLRSSTQFKATNLEYASIKIYNFDQVQKSSEGYIAYAHRMKYARYHGLVHTREDGFMLNASDDAIWEQLKSGRFTTPVLRDWVPYIKSCMISQGVLTPLWCFQCRCALMTATTKHLDTYVSEGLANGLIHIDGHRDADDARHAC